MSREPQSRKDREKETRRPKVTPKKVPEGSLLRALYMLMPLILYYLFRIGMLALLQAGIGILGAGNPGEELSADYTWPVALMTGFTALGLWLVYRKSEPMREDPERTPGKRWKAALAVVLLGALLAMGLNILASFITGNLSESVRDSLNIPKTPQTSGYLAGLVLYGLLSPLSEELLFRWLLLNRIERVFNTKMAIALCALFFGIYHGNVMQGCYAFLMGLALAYICVAAKSLAAAFLFHCSANVVIYSLLFLPEGVRGVAESLPMGALYLLAGIGGMLLFARRKKI